MENIFIDSKELRGKRLLVLGGTSASFDIVKLAQSMGAFVIVTDEADISQRVSKQIADEACMISTDNMSELINVIREKKVDGVFCGPSEFNLKNVIELCDLAGLPCYATPKLWNICSNKKIFKEYCRKNGVPTAPEYPIEKFMQPDYDIDVEYPVIVKPVDGCSSKGISICNNRKEIVKAYEFAIRASKCKKVIIEKYIDNGGYIFSFRYILDHGKYYPYLAFDTFIADPIDKKYLISAFTYFPSNYTNIFLEELDRNIQNMFADMGLKNGTAFIQAIPYNGKIYCHEMGYRLSGGMIYKITEHLMGINDIKMMLRYALGESIIKPEELSRIRLKRDDTVMAQLMIPLNSGKIGFVDGLKEILELKNVIDFLQYYKVGDIITPQVLGTLGQHFGRFTLIAEKKEEMVSLVKIIQYKLKIRDIHGKDMYTMKFDINRLLLI